MRSYSVLRLLSVALVAMSLAGCQIQSGSGAAGSSDAAGPKPTSAAALVRYSAIVHPTLANDGMVVSQNHLASQVGREVLAAGGNAVDAAVAVGFALAVTLPRAGNLGGSGFMLIHSIDSGTSALDFRSAAPAAFKPERYVGDDGKVDSSALKFGAHAAGVPGTVAGLTEAWRRHGSLPWSRLLKPAQGLAEMGIVVSPDLAHALRASNAVFNLFDSSRAVYLNESGRPLEAGERWRQPDLARSIELLSRLGGDAFYTGALAERLVEAVQNDGGYLTRADLASYRVRDRVPLETNYRGKRVVSMPPVSGGGVTLLQMLNVLQNFELAQWPQGGAQSLHLLAETMKRGAANRRFGIGDPDFVDVPLDDALSRATAEQIAGEIRLDAATPVSRIQPRYAPKEEGPDTTHYSIVDKWGNAVAVTYTLGYSFGSGYVAGDTGVLLDNQLRNFSYGVRGHANGHAPGKRMMSTMTPTMVFSEDDSLELVTGTPGGGRIINVLLQLLVNYIDYEMNVAEATHAPRIHQPWRSSALDLEPGHSADTIELLRKLGHNVRLQPSMGSTQSIAIEQGVLKGAADPRRPGAQAAGLTSPR